MSDALAYDHVVCLLFVVSGCAQAQQPKPLLAAIFADHAVLQRDRPIEVWGRAQPDEQVTVALDSYTRKTQADAAGAWAVTLPALRSGGKHTLTARTATRAQKVKDLLIGDVWLCSGQSNMEWTVRNTINAGRRRSIPPTTASATSTIPRLRRADAARGFRATGWSGRSPVPTTTQDFSAVCYYFARELQKSS